MPYATGQSLCINLNAPSYYRELLGYDPEEFIGRKPFDLMPPDEARRVQEMFALFGLRVTARPWRSGVEVDA